MRVVVLGGGLRAAAQALIASDVVGRVSVLAPRQEVDFGHLEHRLGARPNIDVQSDCVISQLRGDAERGLTAMRYAHNATGEHLWMPTRAVFVARGLEFNPACFGSRESFATMLRSGRIWPAGVANAIDPADWAGCRDSGTAAADSLRTRLAED